MHEKTSTLPMDHAEKKRWAHVRGPWSNEPDRVEWRDEKTRLPCIALRVPWSGHWCGYVGVGPDHPWHGKDYSQAVGEHTDDCDVANGWCYSHSPCGLTNVHGGLTFAGACQPYNEKHSEHRVCHTPEPGEPDEVWWFGFDCAHAWDRTPYDYASGSSMRGGYYKDLDFVRGECARLADQLAQRATRT